MMMSDNLSFTLQQITVCGTEDELYTYCITKSKEHTDGGYAIRIMMKIKGKVYEQESGPLFSEYERAAAFLSFLAKHKVTPSNLPYVIEDLLDFEE